MKARVAKVYRKKQRKGGEFRGIICSPDQRGYRRKYKPSERRRLR